LVEVGKEVVVCQRIVNIGLHCHEGYGEEEKKAGKEHEDKRLRVETSFDLHHVSANGISDVEGNVEYDDAPSSGKVRKGFRKGGPWKESEGDNEERHYDLGIGS
jgi:hypothetical protein